MTSGFELMAHWRALSR